jgi:transcriptional regulator with XRE-family HTH domain
MKRTELLQSPIYWTTKIQIDLFNQMELYMKENNLNRTKLAEKLNVTKGYITQVLNGDFDHRISKLVELSMAIGVVPRVNFESMDQCIKEDKVKTFHFDENKYQQDYSVADIENFVSLIAA